MIESGERNGSPAEYYPKTGEKGMKTIRKYARAMACIMAILLAVMNFACAENGAVRFSEDGQLKILIVADTQDTENPQEAMLRLLNASLDTAEPDLVIFLGDMIHGPSVSGMDNVRKAIDAIVSPAAERKIPFAVVFGNHDEECGISNEEQLKIYQSYPGCLTTDEEDLPGCGNTCILVENPVHPEKPVALWLADSGNKAADGSYDCVKEEQNEWMLRTYRQLKTTYSEPVSFVFQHIPVPQVENFLEKASFGAAGAVTHVGGDIFSWYLPDTENIREGSFGEAPCPSGRDSGEFETWKQMNVRAAFFGHDHTNDYLVTWEGIDLVATAGAGFYHYGRGDEHGTRIVTISADTPEDYQTRMLYYKDIVTEPLPGLLVPTLGVLFQKYLFIGIAVLIVLIAVLVWLIRRIRKNRKKKRK